MAYQGDKTLEELLPPGHPFLQPRIVFGMKPPPNGSSASKPEASSAAQADPTLFDPNKPAPAVDMDDPTTMGQLQDYLDEHLRKLDEKEGLISKAPTTPGPNETT